jgi:hypothetical protein
MTAKLTAVSLRFAATLVLPWLPLHAHGGRVNHPLVSLILLILILALVYWGFRRKPG